MNSSEASSVSQADTKPAGRRGGLIPGVLMLTFLAACIVGTLIFFTIDVTPDHAFDHLLGTLLTLIAWFSLLAWFAFGSGYSASVRFGVTGLAIAGMVGFLAAFRPEFSGEMIPTFHARWAPKPDQALGAVELAPNARSVDLSVEHSLRDFPRYFGPDGQGGLDGVRLADSWDEPPRELWRRDVGAGWAGFAVRNGFAVTLEQRGDQELMVCYDLDSGEPVWTNENSGRHETVMGGVGPRGTPLIANGLVYAVGAAGRLSCVEGATGETRWEVDLVADFGSTPEKESEVIAWGRSNSPLLVDDMVVVPAGGPKGNAVSLAAFDADSGELRWKAGDEQISYSSPILGELGGVRQIISVNENSVSGHLPEDGKELWKFEWPGSSSANASTSQPNILADDRLLVSKGYFVGGAMWKIAPAEDGSWSPETLWTQARSLRTKLTSPVHFDGYLYCLSDGILHCVDAESGQIEWRGGRFHHGQILRVHDLLLVLAEGGDLVLVRCAPEQYEELGRVEDAIEGKCWNTLTLAGDRLLIRSDLEAACYELPLAAGEAERLAAEEGANASGEPPQGDQEPAAVAGPDDDQAKSVSAPEIPAEPPTSADGGDGPSGPAEPSIPNSKM